ncbi:Phosphatidylinositol-4-phosphate 5-kinase family protein, related [Neospora caninum Liverpool]|nr:Phosphatidylinositol-4-phosphate 5-kinase family protein, related [Neospora caninum Liverpool]CBZ53314.1 Phosphatidylinositol-4-phosphate 5-kinase family protein, related [Neospora caninum Liverpool]|eukprot:XP_003883346.1 Phosphatidylinositol-4-phosphate 5-kinase family protein, related [Neospora caninum Liverpool]
MRCCGSNQARRRSASAAGDSPPTEAVTKTALGLKQTLQGHIRLPVKMERAVLEDILTKTNLGPKEIKDLYNRFRRIAPDGSLPFSRFCDTLGVLGMVDETFLAERLFNAFDTNGDSTLSFTEFAVALGIMMRGSDDEKLDLSFKILNPTYGGGATCLADYGLGGFEGEDEACSEWDQASAASAPADQERRREASFRSDASGLPTSETLSLARYEALKPQIERDTIGVEDFVLLIHCVDQTRKALIGGSQPSYPDAEIRRVFLQNATQMPDGSSRMMLLDFKRAVRTSPAFLALLGVLPQELAVDTSAGHQCIPAAKKAVSSMRRLQSTAVLRMDSHKEGVEAVKQELRRVREELGRVVDFVNGIVSAVQLEQVTQDAIIAHAIQDDDAAHMIDDTAPKSPAASAADPEGACENSFARSTPQRVEPAGESCRSLSAEDLETIPSFRIRSLSEIEREDRLARSRTSVQDGEAEQSLSAPASRAGAAPESRASDPARGAADDALQDATGHEASAARELARETHAHLRRALGQLQAVRAAGGVNAVEEANKTISRIEAIEARIGRMLSLLRDDDRSSLSSAGVSAGEKENRRVSRVTVALPASRDCTSLGNASQTPASNGGRGSLRFVGDYGSFSFMSSSKSGGVGSRDEGGNQESDGEARGDGDLGHGASDAPLEDGDAQSSGSPTHLNEAFAAAGLRRFGSDPSPCAAEPDGETEEKETPLALARGLESGARDGAVRAHTATAAPTCRKHGLPGSKYRSFASKKVTIRLRNSEASQRHLTDENDADAILADGLSSHPCSRHFHKDSSTHSGEIQLHRMYMNRPNVSKFPDTRRRRRRTILPVGSFRLKRVDSNSSRPTGNTKGLAVHFGHENWDTVINIMVGIRLAAGRASSEPQRAIERYDFVMKEKFSILPNTGMVNRLNDRRSLFAVRFVDYAPMVFRRLRERFQISSETYVRSVGPEQLLGNLFLGNLSSLSELVSEGRSGALFYYTADGKFMIKTISKDTAMFLRSILLDYYEHVMANPDTLLTRFFGLHAIRLKEKHRGGGVVLSPHVASDRRLHKKYFIVMSNFFHTPVEIHRRYDLKGSTYKRQLHPDQLKDSTVALKDLDIDREKEKMELGPERRERILAQMQHDVEFLRAHQIIDYSLLLGIFYRKQEPEDVMAAMVASLPTPPPPPPLGLHQNFRLHHLSGPTQPSPEPHIPFFQAEFGGMWSPDQSKLYYVGIVDILTYWNTLKKLEHAVKTVQ